MGKKSHRNWAVGQSAPCCSWSAKSSALEVSKYAQHPPVPLRSPASSRLSVLLLVCAGAGMSRAGQGPSAPASPSHWLRGAGKAPSAVAVGRAETSLPAAASSRAPQLIFPRGQLMSSCSHGWRVASPAVLCWGTGAVALCPAMLWLVPRGCLQPRPAHSAGCWGFASRERPAAGRAGRQGMLQARCAHGAPLGTGHCWEPQGCSPWISIWDCHNEHSMAGLLSLH